MRKTYTLVTAILLLIGTLLAHAATIYVQLGPYTVTQTLTIGMTNLVSRPFYLTSAMVTFPTGSYNNTITLDIVRNNITSTLLSTQNTNLHYTAVWYPQNKFYVLRNDTILLENTDGSPCQVTINGEYEN